MNNTKLLSAMIKELTPENKSYALGIVKELVYAQITLEKEAQPSIVIPIDEIKSTQEIEH